MNAEVPFATFDRDGEPGFSDSTLFEGTLVLVDGCLYVDSIHGRGRELLAFPDAATWDERAQYIELDGNHAALGDVVALGGGRVGGLGLPMTMPPGSDASRVFVAQHFGPPVPRGTRPDIPFATWHREGGPGFALGASCGGRLVLIEGCLYIGDSRGPGRTLPVFPDAATWDEETQTIELDGNKAAVGEAVALGGGTTSWAGLFASAPVSADVSMSFQAFSLGPPLPEWHPSPGEGYTPSPADEARMRKIEAYGELNNRLRTAMPDRFAQKRGEYRGDFDIAFRFTGDEVPAEAVSIVAESGLPVTLEAGARYSIRDVDVISRTAGDALLGYPDFYGLHYDRRSEEFVLRLVGDPADEPAEDLLAELRARLPEGVPVEIANARIELRPRPIVE